MIEFSNQDAFKFRLSAHDFKRNEKRRPQHRVLVIEDEEESSLLVQAVLRSIDHQIRVEWIRTAEGAESLLRSGKFFDLIIADHFLEGKKTGFDLWRECRKKYSNVPFILTSALDPREIQSITSDESEHLFFLQKPFHVDACRKMIEWFWEGETEHFEPAYEVKNALRLNMKYKMAGVMLVGALALLTSTEMDLSIKLPHYNSPVSNSLKDGAIISHKIAELPPLKPLTGVRRGTADFERDLLLPRSEGRYLEKGPDSSDGKFEKYGHVIRMG